MKVGYYSWGCWKCVGEQTTRGKERAMQLDLVRRRQLDLGQFGPLVTRPDFMAC